MAFKSRRQARYDAYVTKYGLLPFEAREISSVNYSEAPYLRQMIRERVRLRNAFNRQADLNRWSKTRRESEYRDVIRFEYRSRGWLRNEILSPWEMLKWYRQRAIDSGEYHPVKRKTPRKKGSSLYIHLYKGDVQGQKRRAKERRKEQRGTPEYEKYLEQRREQKRRAKERKRLDNRE